jgi:hypothetical protein
MNINFSFYRAKGFTYLIANGKSYKTNNLDEALDLLGRITAELAEQEEEEIQNDHEAI